jgi:hypothetical protein
VIKSNQFLLFTVVQQQASKVEEKPSTDKPSEQAVETPQTPVDADKKKLNKTKSDLRDVSQGESKKDVPADKVKPSESVSEKPIEEPKQQLTKDKLVPESIQSKQQQDLDATKKLEADKRMCFHISINLYQNFSRGSTKT